MQVVVCHLHPNGTYLTDGHLTLDGLEAYTTDTHQGTLCMTGNHEATRLVAHTTAYQGRVRQTEQRDIGVGHGLVVTIHEPSLQFHAFFLRALHEDLPSLYDHPDGIEAAHLPDGIRQ